MNLVIQNYGQGPAFDLTWEVTPSLGELGPHDVALTSLELMNGFEHLAPKQRLETFFGAANELIASKCPPIVVTVRYRNSQGSARMERYTLNPRQFAGILECGESAEDTIANSLKKIATEFSRVTSNGRVRVSGLPDEKQWLRNLRAARQELDAEIAAAKGGTDVEPPSGGDTVATVDAPPVTTDAESSPPASDADAA
ncbi:MAG: hypothetical protein KF773_16840 [Deltaproteobacteria bacterium]|nr:hypothetical protein [Deltaproteobacteria bacterium]